MNPRGLCLGALVIGCVAAVDPAGLSPFGPSKWLVVSTIGFAAVAIMATSSSPRGDDAHRASAWAWAGLLAVLGVSALVNGDTRTALLGHPERHLGVITWILLFALFVVGQRLCRREQRTVLSAAVIAVALLGAYATIELLFGRPIALSTTSDRLGGSFGSASYLGAAAVLLTPIAIGAAVDGGAARWTRVGACAAAVLGGVALVGSGARAAWVGAAVAITVACVAMGRDRHDDQAPATRQRPRPSRSALVLIGVAAAVTAALLAPRLGDVLERDHGAGSRLDEWRVATRVLAEHPLLGVGPEGYRIAVVEGIDAHYERSYGRNLAAPDRAHSAPLDVALSAGIVGGALYLALIGFIVWRAMRLAARGDVRLAGMSLGVIAYAVQSAFLFPIAELDALWWVFAGITVCATSVTTAPSTRRAGTARLQSWTRPLVVGAASMAAVAALVGGVLHVASDRLIKQALTAEAERDWPRAIDTAQQAVARRPDLIGARLVASDAHLRRGSLADVDAALAQTSAALRWSPNDPMALEQHGRALLERASITGAAFDVDRAVTHWSRLIARDPHRTRWQISAGRAWALADDAVAARRAWTIALDLDPDNQLARQLLDALNGVAS